MNRARLVRAKGLISRTAALVLLLVAAASVVFALGRSVLPNAQQLKSRASLRGAKAGPVDTLVVYTYADRDLEFQKNLKYFLKWGVREGDGAEYYVVAQEGAIPLDIPPLPSNVRRVVRHGECWCWGAFGWLLNSGLVNYRSYQYFVLVDSSVRGPYLPPYIPASIPWHRLLTQRLDETTKLVGSVISCEGAPFKGDQASKWRFNPHVQTYAIALDRAALKVLRRDPEVLQCYWDRWDSIWYGELGASSAILNAGYNIDSLIHRFQGVDWRDKKNWECNQRMNPTGDKWMDGYNLSPYEIMFVKVKRQLVHSTNGLALTAAKYSEWIDGLSSGVTDILTNQFIERPEVYKAPYVTLQKARSPQCFDHGFYRDNNPDLQSFNSDEQLWHNFIHSGQFEGRPHRWHCEWEVTPELLDELDRWHEMGHPNVKRYRSSAVIEAASNVRPLEREQLSSELELIRLRSAIVRRRKLLVQEMQGSLLLHNRTEGGLA